MAGTLKKVRFIRPWQNYRVGNEITPNGVLRDWLVGRGYVVIVNDNSPVRDSGVNRMAAPNQRRQQQRAQAR